MAEEKAAADEHGETSQPWYITNKVCQENYEAPPFKLSRVWKEYKEYLKGCPRYPVLGPAEWDLSKWTSEDKRPFEFDGMDDY